MKRFKRKQKDNVVRSTSVLVSAVGADEKLTAMADSDASIYRNYYADVNYTPVGDGDSLVDVIKAGAFDLVHILANVNTDGTIGRTHADRVLRTCAKKHVKLVFFAANAPCDAYSHHFDPGPLNLMMTTARKRHHFPVFLNRLLDKMSTGTDWPTAWSAVIPRLEAPPEDHFIMPGLVLDVRRGGVVLLGKEQTAASKAQGRTLLSQGAGLVSGFSVLTDGDVRYGPIFYCEEGRRVNIGWERSVNSNYDILVAGLDLREWHEPKGLKIDKEHQLKILRKLRQWLRDQNVKSNIDVPLEVEITDRRCHWADCGERKVKGSAYCPRHRDLNLLRE